MLDKKKKAALSAIDKLTSLLDHGDGEDLKGLKMKPIAEMSVTKVAPLKKEAKFGDSWRHDDDEDESPDEEMHESPAEEMAEDEPSDEDKAQIAALYHKYCK